MKTNTIEKQGQGWEIILKKVYARNCKTACISTKWKQVKDVRIFTIISNRDLVTVLF